MFRITLNYSRPLFSTLKYFRCFGGKCKIGVESDKVWPFYMRKGNEKIIVYSAMSDINLREKPKKDNGLWWVLRVTFGMLMSNTDYNMVSTLIPCMRLCMNEYMYDFFFNLYKHTLIYACLCTYIRTHELRSKYHACVLSYTRIILWLHLKVKLKLRTCDLAVRDLGTHLCFIGPWACGGQAPSTQNTGPVWHSSPLLIFCRFSQISIYPPLRMGRGTGGWTVRRMPKSDSKEPWICSMKCWPLHHGGVDGRQTLSAHS